MSAIQELQRAGQSINDRQYGQSIIAEVEANCTGAIGAKACVKSKSQALEAAGFDPNKYNLNVSLENSFGSLSADVTPWVGTGKAIIQLGTGYDEVTGERIYRPGEAVGAILSIVGFGAAARADEIYDLSNATFKYSDDYVDLVSSERRRHILDGDATGGGHRFGTGQPGKSEFPEGWSDDKIMHEISDVATDPNATRKIGRGGRTIIEGTREGIDIRVIQERNGEIITGFPINVPRNPK